MESLMVLLSGGIDSTAMLWWLTGQGYTCHPICVDYGQRAARQEMKVSARICREAGLPLTRASLPQIGSLSKSMLTEAESVNPFHPHRNLLLLTIASAIAYDQGLLGVAIGVHKSSNYPDCTRDFIDSARQVLSSSLGRPVAVIAPFVDLDRRQLIALAKKMKAPLELTYSCLRGGPRHCGRCESCLDRARDLR